MKDFELVVIGGGISGLGVAAEASAHGLQVALFERGQCGGATSGNSLRIIHGGLRYLQSLNFARASRSLRAQAELLGAFPANVVPLRCVMPLAPTGLRSRLPVSIAIEIYRRLAAYTAPSLARYFEDGGSYGARLADPGEFSSERTIANLVPHGALVWHDAIMRRPAEIVKAEVDRIVQSGGKVIEGASVRLVERLAKGFRVEVENDGVIEQHWAEQVVNAAGPNQREIRLAGIGIPALAVRWSLAFNVLVRRVIDESTALALRSQSGRLFFAVPRELPGANRITALGTGYVDDRSVGRGQIGTHDQVVIDFVREFSELLGSDPIEDSEIIGVETGLLPAYAGLALSSGDPNLIGSEQLFAQDGYIELVSTKYTTYREQARKVIAHLKLR